MRLIDSNLQRSRAPTRLTRCTEHRRSRVTSTQRAQSPLSMPSWKASMVCNHFFLIFFACMCLCAAEKDGGECHLCINSLAFTHAHRDTWCAKTRTHAHTHTHTHTHARTHTHTHAHANTHTHTQYCSGTIFAYGQTGTGKTFTMQGGSEWWRNRGGEETAVHRFSQLHCLFWSVLRADFVPTGEPTPEAKGIIPRSFDHIFDQISQGQGASAALFQRARAATFPPQRLDPFTNTTTTTTNY